MKVLQINSTVNRGSVGRHAENVGRILLKNGHQSFIAFARGKGHSKSNLIEVGSKPDHFVHLLETRLFDKHGLASSLATKKLIEQIKSLNVDLIHLRNIHGYYLNYKILFNYLNSCGIPIVWTLHDCWPFTGHCSHFERVNCYRWKTLCFECPNKSNYPASIFIDRSSKNYQIKKKLFTSSKDLTIITPSNWLTNHVNESFFKNFPIFTIRNGIDLDIFRFDLDKSLIEKHGLMKNKVILGVANVWNKFKGLDDFIKLSKKLSEEYKIILVGLRKNNSIKHLHNIIGVPHTNNASELAKYYSLADVFVNPTYSDNFPTTNIESLACGTPVITYNTGGSPEAIDEATGSVVEKGNIEALVEAIETVIDMGKEHYRPLCRERAEKFFNKDDRYRDYLELYESLVNDK